MKLSTILLSTAIATSSVQGLPTHRTNNTNVASLDQRNSTAGSKDPGIWNAVSDFLHVLIDPLASSFDIFSDTQMDSEGEDISIDERTTLQGVPTMSEKRSLEPSTDFNMNDQMTKDELIKIAAELNKEAHDLRAKLIKLENDRMEAFGESKDLEMKIHKLTAELDKPPKDDIDAEMEELVGKKQKIYAELNDLVTQQEKEIKKSDLRRAELEKVKEAMNINFKLRQENLTFQVRIAKEKKDVDEINRLIDEEFSNLTPEALQTVKELWMKRFLIQERARELYEIEREIDISKSGTLWTDDDVRDKGREKERKKLRKQLGKIEEKLRLFGVAPFDPIQGL